MKLPSPVPSDVLVMRSVVGPVEVLQHMPLAVTAEPPSLEILPPETAPVGVMEVIVEVVNSGNTGGSVVKTISLP